MAKMVREKTRDTILERSTPASLNIDVMLIASSFSCFCSLSDYLIKYSTFTN